MKKNLLRLGVFVLLLGIVLFGINDILRLKGMGFDNLEAYYSLPAQSVDVLFLGSSHAFCSFDPAILWEEHGISSYVLSTPSQPIILTYYNLEEALKTQRPAVIVLEGYKCIFAPETETLASRQRNTFGMKFSKNKVDSVLATVESPYVLETMIGPITYHNRYQELQKDDFFPYTGKENTVQVQKGQQLSLGVMHLSPPDESSVFPLEGALPLPESTEIYYRKIIGLSLSYNIPIVVVIAPYRVNEWNSRMLLSVEKIASEYGVDYINGNYLYDELGLDFDTDFFNTTHLNHRGAAKFSHYIGAYMTENHPLPDHRGDPLYSSWDINVKWQTQIKANFELSNTSTLYDYLHLLSLQDDLVVVASLSGDYQRDETMDMPSLLSAHKMDIPTNGAAIFQNGQSLDQIHQGDEIVHLELGSYDLEIRPDFTYQIARITLDRCDNQKVTDGLNFLVYDPYTDTIVDSVGFDATNQYAAVR